MAQSWKKLNRQLVEGYLRIYASSTKIPHDLIDLFFMFYYKKSCIIAAGSDCKISENGTHVTINGDYHRFANSCFGSIEMPSISNIDFEYEYKIHVIKACKTCIGICDVSGIDQYKNRDFAGCRDIANYTYFDQTGILFKHHDWSGNNWEYIADDVGESYSDGDIITMKYNPYRSTLAWFKNDAESPTLTETDIENSPDIVYCLGVFMGYRGKSEIKLL